jgi:outer membrane protein assembly factor BamB
MNRASAQSFYRMRREGSLNGGLKIAVLRAGFASLRNLPSPRFVNDNTEIIIMKRSLVPGIAILSLFAVVSAFGANFDWPQWRGPDRTGISKETGLLKSWPSEGPALVWKSTGRGGGYGSPAVVGGRVFGSGYRGEDEFVWALDTKDGKEIWSVRTKAADRKVSYPEGPRATPTIDGELLFTLGAGGNLVCLETATGKQRWQKEFKSEFGGRMMSGWGFSESPLVDGDKVICTPGGSRGTIVALNKKTGEVLWQTRDFSDRAAYASIVVAEIGGVKQYVQLTGENVVGIAPNDGKVLWRAARHGETAVIPTPIVHDNHVFVTSGYGIGCNLFKISADGGTFKAEEVYANKDMVNHHGGVVLIGEHLYGHSDSKRGWVCMEFKTGKVVWTNRGVGKGAVSFADGMLYTRGESGAGPIVLVEATPTGYKENGRFNQPDRSNKNSWPHPVIANGKLFLRDQDVLLCYDIKTK